MSVNDRIYRWWKQKHGLLRKPLVFTVGLSLICLAPLVGFIPGPGGIIVFLLGIAVLGSEFDWALALQAFFLKTVPKEVKRRWRPTPRWMLAFDAASLCLLAVGVACMLYDYWSLFISSTMGSLMIFIFNRSRLDRLKKILARSKK